MLQGELLATPGPRARRGGAKSLALVALGLLGAAFLGGVVAPRSAAMVSSFFAVQSMPQQRIQAASEVLEAGRFARPVMETFDDLSLQKSLMARIMGVSGPDGATPVLGPEDVGALVMGPQDVAKFVMNALKDQGANVQEGCRVLLSFSAVDEEGPLDSLGQMRPGYFSDPSMCREYFEGELMYRVLTDLAEWKFMGPPENRNYGRNVAQKMLVRAESGNWEDMYMNLYLADTPGVGKRWIIMSIYKHQPYRNVDMR
jgi:hypothetical protein